MQPIAVIGGLLAGANDRILDIEVKEQDGKQADTLSITLDDRDQAVPIPQNGATLSAAIGYADGGLVPKGTFIVDGVTVSAPPYTFKVHAKSFDTKGPGKEKGTKTYEKKTVGEIVQDTAKRMAMGAVVSPGIAGHKVDFVARSDESPIHFLTRLAEDYDCTFKCANGKVLFFERGLGLSAGGLGMGSVVVSLGNLLDYRCEVIQRPRHKEGQKRGWDRDKGEEFIKKGPGMPVPLGSKSKDQAPYPSSDKGDAERKAKGRGTKSKRKRGQLSLTIVGTPGVTVETIVVVAGVRAGVDGVWRAKSVTHHLSGSSVYTTKIECDKPNAGTESEAGGGGGGGPGLPVPLP